MNKSYYLGHVQMKLNSSFLKISSSLNSSSLPRIFASSSSSSSSQLRLFSSSAKTSISFEFEFKFEFAALIFTVITAEWTTDQISAQ